VEAFTEARLEDVAEGGDGGGVAVVAEGDDGGEAQIRVGQCRHECFDQFLFAEGGSSDDEVEALVAVCSGGRFAQRWQGLGRCQPGQSLGGDDADLVVGVQEGSEEVVTISLARFVQALAGRDALEADVGVGVVGELAEASREGALGVVGGAVGGVVGGSGEGEAQGQDCDLEDAWVGIGVDEFAQVQEEVGDEIGGLLGLFDGDLHGHFADLGVARGEESEQGALAPQGGEPAQGFGGGVANGAARVMGACEDGLNLRMHGVGFNGEGD